MKQKFSIAMSLAVIMSMLFTSVGLADYVVNNIDNTIDAARETRSIAVGGSTSVGFYIKNNNSDPNDINGCNATGSSPAIVNLNVPANVTASATTLTFTGCEVTQSVNFSSNTTGTYTIAIASVTGGKDGSAWNTEEAKFDLIVSGKTTPTITWANPATITYGTALSASQLNATASVVGSFAYSPDFGVVLNAGAGQTLHVDFTPSDATLYNNASKNVTINVLQASSTVTVTCPASVSYNGSAQTPCSATATGAGGLNEVLTVNYTNNTATGTATASASYAGDANHTGSNGSTTFEISKASVTATAGSGSATYDGSTKSPSGCVVAGTYTGDLTCVNDPASVGPNAGTYTIAPAVSGTGLGNFEVGLVNGSYTIDQASSTVTVTCSAGPFVYGGSAIEPCSAIVTGAGNFELSLPVTYSNNVNAGLATANASYAGGINHMPSTGSANFTINPKAASVTPNAASKTYGDADPALTGTLSGFLAADNVTATYSRVAGETVLAGPYAISATLNAAAGVLANYSITYNTADFTINPKAASVTPNAASKTYGDADPALTGTLSGFLSADNVTATYNRATGETVSDGPYTISATLSPVEVLSNYFITYNTADFTINPKAASVTPNAASKTYGDVDPALTGTLSGFLAADNVTATYNRATGETVSDGPYTISATLVPVEVLSNYSITYNTANFTINPKAASVTPNAASKTYGDADPALTGTLSGFLAADNVTATYSRAAGETVSDGPYTISATLAPVEVLSNYSITYNTADFTINKAMLIVTADNKSIIFGQPLPTFTFQYSGFVNGETASVIDVAPTCSVGPIPMHGSYPINCSGGSDNNYNFTYTPGTLAVQAWLLKGFYAPVDMGIHNLVKGGATVPLKFEIFSGSTELTNTNVIQAFTQKVSCTAGAGDDIEQYATGGTSLRYDTTSGQFIFNWQTTKSPGSCYRVTMKTLDGSTISTDFTLK